MQYRVYLQGDQDALRWLVEHCAGGIVRVLEVDGRFHLVSATLDLIEDLGELHAGARALAEELAGIVTINDFGPVRPIRVSGIDHIRDDGTINHTVHPGSATIVNAFEVSGDRLTELALQEANVAEVLRYVGQAPTWGWLTNIIDIIRRDTNGRADSWWDPDGEIELMKATANNPELSGFGGRHGVQEGDAPRKALPFRKARRAVLRLVRQWLRWVSHGRPNIE